jgi:hypothetical protein
LESKKIQKEKTMKQNEEQKTLTLTLPFLDFKDTDVNINPKDSYKDSGIYFVRSNVGEYLIACAVKENQDAWIWPFLEKLGIGLTKQNYKYIGCPVPRSKIQEKLVQYQNQYDWALYCYKGYLGYYNKNGQIGTNWLSYLSK